MVDEFGAVDLQLDGLPHPRVEVCKVVVHVDALVAVATQGPARQLRALRMEGGRFWLLGESSPDKTADR